MSLNYQVVKALGSPMPSTPSQKLWEEDRRATEGGNPTPTDRGELELESPFARVSLSDPPVPPNATYAKDISVSPRTHVFLTPIQSNSTSSEESITHILSASWNPQTQIQCQPVPKPLVRSQSQPGSSDAEISSSNLNKFAKNYIIPAAKWAYSPLKRSEENELTNEELNSGYKIEYSVFKGIRNLHSIRSEKDFIDFWKQSGGNNFQYPENYLDQDEFENLVDRIVRLIETEDLQPQRISQGSSGSYFVLDRKLIDRSSGIVSTYKVGVFKPKDEEPYGPLSPKWTKWLHRTFFPCFFGRSCLIPNLGYISEAAASVLDKQLLSYIVPHTNVIYLRSPSLYYSYWNKSDDIYKLPKKIGSFQMFLNGYMEAQSWFRSNPIPGDISGLPETSEVASTDALIFRWSKEVFRQFTEELEKLVILDYIMRNTDRGLDNWMIKVSWKKVDKDFYKPSIQIGAIDSGLAFPWKRPDEWRSFPFGWLFLPMSVIGQPFSKKTRIHYLTLLTSKYWWETTVVKLREVFERDNDFKERMWLKQLAVLKGQAFNVVEILKLSYAGPLELTRRENLLVWDHVTIIPKARGDKNLQGYEFGESSPLFPGGLSSNQYRRKSDYGSLLSVQNENDEESLLTGYEYNEELENEEINQSGRRQGQNRKVIMERLEKVNSKPPVFTWC